METSNIYPKIEDILNKEKAKHILEFLAGCKKDLKHYSKLKRRYSVINNIVKYSSYTVLTASEVIGIILAVFGTCGIMVPIIIGSAGFLETIISGLISDGILNRKKEHFKNICNKISIFISKFYLFTNQILADGIINDEELRACEKLQSEYNSLLNEHKEVIKKEENTARLLIEDQLKLQTEKLEVLTKEIRKLK